MKRNMQHFGEHLMLDLYGVIPSKISPSDKFTGLLENLVKICGMNKLGETVSYEVKELENSERDFGGITAFQVVKESHLSIHTFEKVNFVSMDLYTCKELPVFEILEEVKKYFGTNDVEMRLVKRGLRYKKFLDEYLKNASMNNNN